MPGINTSISPQCARHLRACHRHGIPVQVRKSSSKVSTRTGASGDGDKCEPESGEGVGGAMTRRLQEMSEQSLESSGRNAQRMVEEAGFSNELKRELEKKIAEATFQSNNAGAFALHNMPSGATKGTRDIAAAKPWSGSESIEDTSFRMLQDAHKPLRGTIRPPSIIRSPTKMYIEGSKTKVSAGSRLANARERTALYEQRQGLQEQEGLSDEEREKFRQQMKMRFQPGASPVPASVQGLTSLANKKIEDAIARGQFKNLPDRGRKMERDYNANSPFINTTEYFLNKMIKKQEIVPPWIEKQQEVVAAVATFRRRLRADWRRHVSRSIASRGGSLESQVHLADQYALAEVQENPVSKKTEELKVVNKDGQVSQITLTGELKSRSSSGNMAVPEEHVDIMEQILKDDGSLKSPEEQVRDPTEATMLTQEPLSPPPERARVLPFRDTHWEATERSYHNLAIKNLNDLTRSYNLMAPDLAKKPYFSLDRELQSCFADVAPQIAAALRERAVAPRVKGIEVVGHRPGSVLSRFSVEKARVYDERKPQYGFKEFWRDLFAKS